MSRTEGKSPPCRCAPVGDLTGYQWKHQMAPTRYRHGRAARSLPPFPRVRSMMLLVWPPAGRCRATPLLESVGEAWPSTAPAGRESGTRPRWCSVGQHAKPWRHRGAPGIGAQVRAPGNAESSPPNRGRAGAAIHAAAVRARAGSPAGAIVTATAGGPLASPSQGGSGSTRLTPAGREAERGVGKASPERWEGEQIPPRSGRHPDQPVRK